MHKVRRKKDALELADLILKHDPDASPEQIAGVMSEWGDLFDDQKFTYDESIDIECAPSKDAPQSRT